MATATEPKNGLAAAPPDRSLIVTMSEKYGVQPGDFFHTLKATVIGEKSSKEETIAFLMVADKYNLNPFTKEIYAFPKKGGGIQPIVSIDGWAKLINEHPQFDGMTFVDVLGEDGKIESITCRMYRKDRSHPIECTEYFRECKRSTEPWNQWPRRMLRHKAMIQAARYAFGLAGIMDPDEAERAESVGWSQQPPTKVGVSNVNKLLDAMPTHKPQQASQDAAEGVDDEPTDDDGNQDAGDPLAGLHEALAACKTKQDCQAVAKRFYKPGLSEEQINEASAACDERSDGLPDAAKGKQKTAFE